jgi:hypothetical protein
MQRTKPTTTSIRHGVIGVAAATLALLGCNGTGGGAGGGSGSGGSGGRGGDDLDAGVQPREPDFTEHESEYSCVGDPDTLLLLHFNEVPFKDACGVKLVTSIPTDIVEPEVKFGSGVRLNTGSPFTQYVDADPELTESYTIEAWIQLPALPSPGDTMVIASILRPVGDQEMVEDGAWRLGVTAEGELRLDLFADGEPCNTLHGLSPFVTDPLIQTDVLTHVRAVVTPSHVDLYIDGFKELSEDVLGAPLCDETNARFRVGGVDRQGRPRSDMINFPAFVGFIDEVRLSRIAL